MTDEELTELECVIDDCIREAVSNGFRLAVGEGSNYCALAAAGDTLGAAWNEVFGVLGIIRANEVAFGIAFDRGHPSYIDGDACTWWDMGLRFRERVLSGEYRS